MAEYIEKAITNIINQTVNFNIEILVCDDCSNDNTLKILANFEFLQNFIIVKNTENLGVLKSLNKLINLAKGQYIALLDADDYWASKNHLQSHFDIYENNKEIGFIFGNYKIFEEKTGKWRIGMPPEFLFPKTKQFEFSIINYPILTSTSSFRKDLLTIEEVNNYILNKFPTSDYGIYLGLMLKTTGCYISEASTLYNFRNNSQSRKSNVYARIDHIINRHKIGDYFIAKHPVSNQLLSKRNFLFNQKILLASWLTNNFDFIKGKAKNLSLIEFIKYNPKAAYIHIASHSKILYKLLRPWVLRKRPPGK